MTLLLFILLGVLAAVIIGGLCLLSYSVGYCAGHAEAENCQCTSGGITPPKG